MLSLKIVFQYHFLNDFLIISIQFRIEGINLLLSKIIINMMHLIVELWMISAIKEIYWLFDGFDRVFNFLKLRFKFIYFILNK